MYNKDVDENEDFLDEEPGDGATVTSNFYVYENGELKRINCKHINLG